MCTKVFSRACLLSLVAAVSLAAGAANADDLASPRRGEVTGAIDARASGIAEPSPVVGRARAAVDRFTEARAAMAHGLLLRENGPKRDIAAVQSYMKDLRDDLTAVEQMDMSGSGASAKEARQLADDWFRTGMQILAPPANGLTEMPLPMLVNSKADQVALALDWLVAEATAKAPSTPSVAPAAPTPSAAMPPQPFAAAVPPVAIPPVVIPPPSAMRAAPAMRPAAHMGAPAAARTRVAAACGPRAGRPAHAKPMTQNEASARLLVEGLPLFLPPAALFIYDHDACRP